MANRAIYLRRLHQPEFCEFTKQFTEKAFVNVSVERQEMALISLNNMIGSKELSKLLNVHCQRTLCSQRLTRFPSNLVVVLDMDECLIHSRFMGDDHYRQKDYRPNSTSTNSLDSFRVSLPDGDLVQVHKRPGLDNFLNEVSQRFETHVFTAAMEVYARPVLDSLDPNGEIFCQRFYRECCTLNSELGCYVKNMHTVRQNISSSSITDFRRMVSTIFKIIIVFSFIFPNLTLLKGVG